MSNAETTGGIGAIEFAPLLRSFAHDSNNPQMTRLKTGFRAKDAKNAKKLLQGELVEFVYESFDVTFEELTAKVYQ